jgi:hypothetical protein
MSRSRSGFFSGGLKSEFLIFFLKQAAADESVTIRLFQWRLEVGVLDLAAFQSKAEQEQPVERLIVHGANDFLAATAGREAAL